MVCRYDIKDAIFSPVFFTSIVIFLLGIGPQSASGDASLSIEETK